jgi:hypothetical protein
MQENGWEAMKARRHSPPNLSNVELGGVLGACLVVAAVSFAPGWQVYLAILVGVVTGSGLYQSLNQ